MPRLLLVSEASRSDGLEGKGQRRDSEPVGRKQGDAGVGCGAGGLCQGEERLKVFIKIKQCSALECLQPEILHAWSFHDSFFYLQ